MPGLVWFPKLQNALNCFSKQTSLRVVFPRNGRLCMERNGLLLKEHSKGDHQRKNFNKNVSRQVIAVIAGRRRVVGFWFLLTIASCFFNLNSLTACRVPILVLMMGHSRPGPAMCVDLQFPHGRDCH